MTEPNVKKIENEEGINEIIKAQLLSLKEAKDTEEENVEKNLPEIIEQLPKGLRSNFAEKFKRLEGYGLNREELLVEINESIREMNTSYIDKRFGISNGSYMRLEITDLVDNFVKETDPVKIKGSGILNLDVNGLKSVNDLMGHEKGDDYLRKMVEVFKSGNITKDLESKGIKVLPHSNGGDEFAIILSGDINLTEVKNGQTLIDEILKSYQKEISSLDMSDIINFSDPKVKEKFDGIKIPENFNFTASISGGTTVLSEVLLKREVLSEEAKLDYSKEINKIMGDLLKTSDERGKIDKDTFKQGLAESTDENERFLSAVLKRNEETAILEIENRKLKEEAAESEKKTAEILEKLEKRLEEIAEMKKKMTEQEIENKKLEEKNAEKDKEIEKLKEEAAERERKIAEMEKRLAELEK